MSDIRKWISLVENAPVIEGTDDMDHGDALRTTGFWGARGAGCLFLARSTGRFLISHRSAHVEQPNTFGCWGGAIDRGEDPADAVKREAHEEAGYEGAVTLEPLYVFKKGTFSYFNFLAIIDEEFKPRLDWENQGYVWCKWGEWPSPMHFGLTALVNDPESARKMQTLAAECENGASNDTSPRFRKRWKSL